MRLDGHLVTGIFLGVLAGIFFTESLVVHKQLLVIATVILTMRYIVAK
jgi:hypothetical protein